MDQETRAFHYVCTREEAWDVVQNKNRFWVSKCGCRENRGRCTRSRTDLCLQFRDDISGGGGSDLKEVSLVDVEEIFREATEKHLVTRPFRNEDNMAETDGICFCCDDCCDYFLDPTERCDKGDLVENTASVECKDCGTCVTVCYFGARKVDGQKLLVDRAECYGCGLCVDVCPEDCIRMVRRE